VFYIIQSNFSESTTQESESESKSEIHSTFIEYSQFLLLKPTVESPHSFTFLAHQQSSMMFPFQESRFLGGFSRISEIQAPPQFQVQVQVQDPERIGNSRELNYKLKKVHGKLDTAAGCLGTTLKHSMDQIVKSCQSVKSLSNEQTKLITKQTFDIQQQMGQLSTVSAMSKVRSGLPSHLSHHCDNFHF
jgi:hypothetical protein